MIRKTQNQKNNLMLLAAQRRLYSEAKYIWYVKLFTCIMIVIAFNLIAFVAKKEGSCLGVSSESAELFLIFYCVIILAAELFVFDPFIDSKKEEAAIIQEFFDCNVLELPRNQMLITRKISLERIIELSDKCKNKHKLENWYDLHPSISLPLYAERVMAQRENISWDAWLRTIYCRILWISMTIFILVFSYLSLSENLPARTLLIYFLAPLAPMAFFVLREIKLNKQSISSLLNLQEHLDDAWDAVRSKKSKTKMRNKSRQLQDYIFLHRKNSPMIPDWFYLIYKIRQGEISLKTSREMANDF